MIEEQARSRHVAETVTSRRSLEWVEIEQRLEFSRIALEQKLNPGPEERQKILKSRAKLLAHEIKAEEKQSQSLEAVEFILAHEHYAIESKYLSEVHPLRAPTSLPGTPPFVLGLVNVRGQILPVIDLKILFELPATGPRDSQKVMIVRSGEIELGILADAVFGARAIALEDLQDSLPTLTGMRAEYVRGIVEDSLVILDVERILSDPRLIVNDEDLNRPNSAVMIQRGRR
jgi:purine-binding chemotaxis protein CheW